MMTALFDTIYVGGSAYTAGFGTSRPLGVAVRDGRIAAFAPDEKLIEAGAADVVDLRGGLVMPAFHDAHAHPVSAGVELLECDLTEATSAEEAIGLIRQFAVARPDAEWIKGGGWTLGHFPGGTPSKQMLDGLAEVAGRPVALHNRDHHGMWVNSEALKRAGITTATPDPHDGRIERNEFGEPSGVLHEGAMGLIQAVVPVASVQVKAEGLALAQQKYFRYGLVGWQDAYVGAMPSIGDIYDTYFEAAVQGTLRARVTAALWWDRSRGLEQIPELIVRRKRVATLGREDVLLADTVKIMVDGIVENYTAAISQPYKDGHGATTHNCGLTFLEPEKLRETVEALDAADFNVHFHSLGDRAVTLALDAVESALAANRRSTPRRHHLAHLQMVQASDIERFVKTGSWANLQTLWAAVDEQLDELTFPFIDDSLVTRHYPFGELCRAGVQLAAGSDWPVSTQDPIPAIHTAVNRAAPGHAMDARLGEHQKLSLADALAAYTAGSAAVNGRGERTGQLKEGYLADLVVLDRDLFEYPEEEIFRAEVAATILAGEKVFDASASSKK